jgi:hypothetical protein
MIPAHIQPTWLYEIIDWPVNATGGYPFFSSLGLGSLGIFAVYKQHNCKARWWCPLWSHHKVAGTTASVCHAHHTVKLHQRLQRRHERKHPYRLAHGDSPRYGDRHGQTLTKEDD